jgi:hypothetical protein
MDTFHEDMNKNNTNGSYWIQAVCCLTYDPRLKDNLRSEYLAFYEKSARNKAQPERPKKQLRI